MDPITLTIMVGSFLAGAAIGYFWDEILAWAERAVKAILDAINYAIEVTTKAIIYLVKQGRRYYKRAEVYARNIYTKITRLLSGQEEIAAEDIPEELSAELEYKTKVKIAQQAT